MVIKSVAISFFENGKKFAVNFSTYVSLWLKTIPNSCLRVVVISTLSSCWFLVAIGVVRMCQGLEAGKRQDFLRYRELSFNKIFYCGFFNVWEKDLTRDLPIIFKSTVPCLSPGLKAKLLKRTQ